MDRVRFAIGTNHVFQGFHRKGDGGMVGATVYVTAHVLAEVVNHIQTDINADDWNRVHNAPQPEMDALAFGADRHNLRVAPDGFTLLYPITTFEATIVQRYNPQGKTASGWDGVWVHEDVIDSFEPWQDMEPETFKPVTHGFYIDPQSVAEGRSDAPLILTMSHIVAEEVKANGWDLGDSLDLAAKAVAETEAKANGWDDIAEADAASGRRYIDHDGNRTADPRCELGFCVACIDSSLERGEVPAIPALSTHDPKYLTDSAYRIEVTEALAVAGLTIRED